MLPRLAKATAAGLAAVALVLGAASVDWGESRGAVEAVWPAPGPLLSEGTLAAGAARVPIRPPAGVPLGGFSARRGRGHQGVRDAVSARAVVLEGDGVAVALVALDVLLVPPALARAVTRRVAPLGLEGVVVTATHTHNGPGAHWDTPLAEAAGLGAYDPDAFEALVAAADAAVRRAWATRAPADLALSEARAPQVCRSRVPGREADDRLTRLTLRPAGGSGRPIGRVVLFACHPTLLGRDDLRISAEWPGALASRLGEPSLVLQGGLGDQTAGPLAAGASRERRMEALAEALAGVRPGEERIVARPALGLRTVRVRLPDPRTDHLVPAALGGLAENLLDWLGPDTARVTALRLGPVLLAFVPGEPVAPLAALWERRLTEAAGLPVRVVGLADGYVGYLETPEAFARGAGESRRAWHGGEAVDLLGEALTRAVEHLGGPAPTPYPAIGARTQ